MSTKEKILDAALTLFAENGYDGTSVEQIANIVGIKAPSLYKHYKGKEDILNALIDSAEERISAIMKRQPICLHMQWDKKMYMLHWMKMRNVWGLFTT